MEAILLIATGKSRRAEKEIHAVRFGEEMARINAAVEEETTKDAVALEVMITTGSVSAVPTPLKRYLVNGVAKRRVDFASHMTVVSFSPADLEIISDGPSYRRGFLDDVLEQVDRQYRLAILTYTKALRQRNALLHQVKETGVRNQKQFEYWDSLLITHGSYITKQREMLISYINTAVHAIFPITLTYDSSIISSERLAQYKDAEVGSGVTLVGPHRDDVLIDMIKGKDKIAVKTYGSRGQQRLAVLQLKLLQLLYIEGHAVHAPLLLLDDIFSELDEGHIQHVQTFLGKKQTVITTTHKEFLDKGIVDIAKLIEL
jgi:DNA replication and repair protein RecF